MTQVQGQNARNHGMFRAIHRRKRPISARSCRLHECQSERAPRVGGQVGWKEA